VTRGKRRFVNGDGEIVEYKQPPSNRSVNRNWRSSGGRNPAGGVVAPPVGGMERDENARRSRLRRVIEVMRRASRELF